MSGPLAFAAFAVISLAGACPAAPFRFVQMSDLHLGHGAGHPHVEKAVAGVKALNPAPAFVVLTGDLVEVGRPEHWAFLDPMVIGPLAGLPLKFVTGNHETAWSGLAGKPLFRRATGGPTQYAERIGPCLLAVLDSAIPGHQHGHLGPAQLAWLDALLSASSAAVNLVALHHPPFREAGVRFLDDEAALFAVLSRRPRTIVLCGHGHMHNLWRYREVPLVMCGSAYQVGFAEYRVEGRAVTVAFHTFDAGGAPVPSEERAVLNRDGRIADRGAIPELNEGELPRREGPELPAGVEIRWARTLGGAILSQPQVSEGRVVVSAGEAGVFCLEGATGRTIWSATLSGFASASPRVAAGLAVVGDETGALRAFSAADGALMWTRTLPGALAAAPALVGDTLVVAAADGTVAAVTLSGEVRGTARIGWNPAAEPGTDGHGAAYLTSWSGDLAAAGADGRIAWSRSILDSIYFGPGRSSPAWVSPVVVVTTGRSKAIGLNPATGRTRWESPGEFSYASARAWMERGRWLFFPVQRNYALLPEMNGTVTALDARNGRRAFSIRTGGSTFSSQVAVADGRAYLTGFAGSLQAVDLAARQPLWSANLTSDFVFSSPAAAGGAVFVGTTGGMLFALEDGVAKAATGRRRGRRKQRQPKAM